jgi:nicotinamide-nucleotide adenylyltransferase
MFRKFQERFENLFFSANYMKTALFLGRFQPFHKGHFDALQQIFETGEFDRVLIGIGSADENYSFENPLTAGERWQIIDEALKENGISTDSYAILPARNINQFALWTRYIRQLFPFFETVFSGSPFVRHLWEQEPEIEVRGVQKRITISATEVRQQVLIGGAFESLLFPTTISLCKKFTLRERLSNLETEL